MPEFLDVAEQVRPVTLADDLAEDLAQQPDVTAHRGRNGPRVSGAPVGVHRHAASLDARSASTAGRDHPLG
jgi:hypothetical protein